MEEGELIRRMKRGDPAALEALMDRDMAFACGVASSILRDAPRDVEEVVSDSFLALWNNAHKLVPGPVRGYPMRASRGAPLGAAGVMSVYSFVEKGGLGA